MNVVCTRENLLAGLEQVSRVANKNITLPILNNVLLTTDRGGLQLQTTNLEIAVTTSIRAKVQKEGKYTVQAKLLHDVVRSLRGQRVTLTETPGGLLLESEDTTTTLKGLSAEDFPVPPALSAGVHLEAPSGEIESALQEVLFAAASDESRPEISGVFMKANKKKLDIVATDSYRLAVRTVALPQEAPETISVIVPARSAQELVRILHDADQVVQVDITDQQISWTIGETIVVSRLIEGRYPEYEEILPTRHATSAQLDRGECIDALKAASLFCQPGIHDVTLQFTPGEPSAKITAESSQTGAYHGSIPSTTTGQGVTIVFNYRYLIDGLQSLHGDQVVFELGDSQAPALLHGTGPGLHLIMPIRQ